MPRRRRLRASQPLGRLNLVRFGISSLVFLILYFIIIVITTNHHSSAGSVALDLSMRTWVRSQVPAFSLFSFLSTDPVSHNLKRLPYNLNIQPFDALLPRSNTYHERTMIHLKVNTAQDQAWSTRLGAFWAQKFICKPPFC